MTPSPYRFNRRLLLLAAVASLAALLALPAASPAAKRKVPFGFFGTTLNPEMTDPATVSDGALEQQAALMARSGVETVRITFGSSVIEPARGSYDWGRLDRVIAAAARHRVAVLANLTQPTRWNVSNPADPEWRRYPPLDPAPWAEMMRQAVLRYGPNGTFWAQNPGLPKVPVRQWQIWNEQTAPWHWNSRPWAPSYTALLKATYQAIKSADSGARVVAGSLVAFGSNYAQWDGIRDLYRAGAKRYFDVVAVHPFTNNSVSVSDTAARTVQIIGRVRTQMRSRGDGRKPIILTEMTWPASKGKVPEAGELHFSVTPRGQKARLEAAYAQLIRARTKLRITQAHWYTWATPYDQSSALSVVSFRYSGLNRIQGGSFTRMPLLGTYTGVARRYQGCRKSANARRCR